MRIRLTDTNLVAVEGKDVLFSTRTGESYGLNETAARMLRLSLEMSVEQAAARLADEYGAPSDEILDDLTALVNELTALKMVQPVADQGA
jgi:hypothetical protein